MTQPTDDELIAFLRTRPKSRLAAICAHFDIPWQEAKRLCTQLQRLRRASVLRSGNGQTWEVRG